MLKPKSLSVSICPNPYIHLIQEGKTHVLHVILLPTEIVLFFGKTGMVNIQKDGTLPKVFTNMIQLLGVSCKTTFSILQGKLK